MESLSPILINKPKHFASFSAKQNAFVSSISTKQLSRRTSELSFHQFKHSQSNASLNEMKCCFKNQLISRKIGLSTNFKVNQLNLTLLKPKNLNPKVIISPISFDYQIKQSTNSNFNNKFYFLLKKPKTRNTNYSWNVSQSYLFQTILNRRMREKSANNNCDYNNNSNCKSNYNDYLYEQVERNYEKTLLNSKKHITVSLLLK